MATKKRVAGIIEAYDRQGVHRTGTETDSESARWLADQIAAAGQAPVLSGFPHSRVDLIRTELLIDGEKIAGFPLFDGTFTDANGVTGKIGKPGDGMPIAVGHYITNHDWADSALSDAQRRNKFKAMIAICRQPSPGDRPGLTPTNADDFTAPFGPPVLQVASGDEGRIMEAVSSGTEGRLISQVERTDVEAFNVEVRIKGGNSALSPIVIITPRSGWWQCASERGGGIAIWLEMIRALSENQPVRDVWFVASTGHELGHLGLDFFLDHHQALIQDAFVWIHLGANPAAVDSPVRLQASDEDLLDLATNALADAPVPETVFTPVGTRPMGEARNLYDGGGRFISLLGNNHLFHHPDDRWPDAVDLEKITGITEAFTGLAIKLASS
jgi:hypothetical protein